MNTATIVQKLWNYCNVLRDDGMSYGDYVEQLTYLLFLKMADERSRPPYNQPSPVLAGYDWPSLVKKDGDELFDHYRHTLEELGKQKGMLNLIFSKSQNKFQDPAKLRRLIVDLIDKETWVSMSADVKGDAYEGLLLQELEANGSAASSNTRFVVISKDSGFDALMNHVQSLGYGAMKAASIRQALGLDEPVTGPGSALQLMSAGNLGSATPSPVAQISSKPPAVKKAAPVAKAQPAKPVATPKKTAAAQAKPAMATEKKPQPPARKTLGPEDKEKVIEHLRLHPKNRPVKRKTLESHITSLLGGNVTIKAVRALVAGLENEKVIKFTENKIDEYKIPKRKK